MVYYELVVTIQMQVDVAASRSFEYLSRMLSTTMLYDRQLKDLHGQQGFKNYTFCNLYPLEDDKVYRKNRVYLFNIRSLNLDFLLKIKHIIKHIQYGVIATELKTFEYKRPILQLKTLTPVVATVNNRSWTQEDGIKILMERIHINCLKKYRTFVKNMEEPADNLIEYINLLNKKPIKISYKQNSFLGHKLAIGIKSDATSQNLAFAAIGAGLLEKNSIGFGYCLYE